MIEQPEPTGQTVISEAENLEHRDNRAAFALIPAVTGAGFPKRWVYPVDGCTADEGEVFVALREQIDRWTLASSLICRLPVSCIAKSEEDYAVERE